VVTDNGPEVKGAFTELLHRLNIPQVQISAYNKQANGVVERGWLKGDISSFEKQS